ncbi:MAG: hypothetical protein ONB05_07450, partial [candidate division KSB1 bacterium]|nr:hypothetical protein [candidate division KSB1 bacterium]
MSIKKLLVVSGLILILGFNARGQESPYEPRISYSLSLDEVTWNAFQVAITVSNPNQPRLVFVMPVWMPGAYVRMDFGKNVRNFKAQGTRGQSLEVIQLDDHRWSVAAGTNSVVRVSYQVEVSPRGFMGRSLDSTRARIDGPATFMYVQGLENLPVTVRFNLPKNWKVATGLRSTSYLFEYTAKNYDTLIDSPVEMGDFVDYYFNHQGRNFTITIDGDTSFNIENFLLMINKIVSYQADLFNDLPFENYLFMFNVYPDYRGGGGLEHHNSTTIGLSGKKLAEDVESAANVIAHEFFHLWNVKRIHPRLLGPAFPRTSFPPRYIYPTR